jgi:hypothetical protein
MFHLGFFGLLGLPCRAADCLRYIRQRTLEQQNAPGALAVTPGKPLLKFHPMRTDRLRVSQNAAVLLFEFDAVDVR